MQAGASTFDFFAAGMITNFFVWLWNSSLVSLPLLSVLDDYSVTVLSYMVYVLGSVVGCNLLILKARGDASKTCLKSAPRMAWTRRAGRRSLYAGMATSLGPIGSAPIGPVCHN